MKIFYFSIVFLSVLIHSNMLYGNINFENGTYDDIVTKAKITGKPVFIDVYGDYCTNCQYMEDNVFSNKNVAEIYNKNFINYKINAGKSENSSLKNKYEILFLPTLLFLSPEGELIKKHISRCSPEELTKVANEILNSKKPAYDKTPIKPNLNQQNIIESLYEKMSLGIPYNSELNEYIKKQENMLSMENRKLILDFAIDLENLAIDKLIEYLPYFKDNFNSKEINEKIKQAISISVERAGREGRHDLFEKAEKIIAKVDLDNKEDFLFRTRFDYYSTIGDLKRLDQTCTDYLSRFDVSDPVIIYDIGVAYLKWFSETNKLLKVIGWLKKSIAIENEYYNNLILAKLFEKTKNYTDAKSTVNEAIMIANFRGTNAQEALILNQNLQRK